MLELGQCFDPLAISFAVAVPGWDCGCWSRQSDSPAQLRRYSSQSLDGIAGVEAELVNPQRCHLDGGRSPWMGLWVLERHAETAREGRFTLSQSLDGAAGVGTPSGAGGRGGR